MGLVISIGLLVTVAIAGGILVAVGTVGLAFGLQGVANGFCATA